MANTESGSQEPVGESTELNDESPGIMWNVQAGAFIRLGGKRYNEYNGESGSLMGTVDLSWLKWDRKHWTWGLGIHSAFSDDGGPRFGPRALYRTPLGSRSSFFQASGGVYLAAIDQEMTSVGRINLPGYFIEAEYGISDHFSVVAGAEAIPVDLNNYTEGAAPTESATITNYWLGAKGGQLMGLLAIVAAGLFVALYAAALSS